MSIFGVKFGPDFDKPVEKVEKVEKQEKKCENVEEVVAYYAEKVNKIFQKHRKGDQLLVDDGCRINPSYFNTENSGAYSDAEVEEDEELKEELYNQWAARLYGLTEDTDVDYIIEKVAEYKRNRENSRGEQAEKLLLVNLNKVLAPDYFAIHASDYDDLSNGIDYVVVEAETGIIACGLDAFYDKQDAVQSLDELMRGAEDLEKKLDSGEEAEHTYQQKLVKLKKVSQRYGAKIKYGFSIKDDELQSGYMANMPAFTLRLSPADFGQLQADMNFVVEGENSRPSDTELRVFDGMINSLEEQSAMIAANPKVNPEVLKNLDVFNQALEKMKGIREKI